LRYWPGDGQLQLIELYGQDARIFLLQSLVAQIDFKSIAEQSQGSGNNQVQHKDSHRLSLLVHEVAQAATKPNFVSLLCQALEGQKSSSGGTKSDGSGPVSHLSEEQLQLFVKALHLSCSQQVAVGLSLAHSSTAATATAARSFILSKLPEVIDTIESDAEQQLENEILHNLTGFLATLAVGSSSVGKSKADGGRGSGSIGAGSSTSLREQQAVKAAELLDRLRVAIQKSEGHSWDNLSDDPDAAFRRIALYPLSAAGSLGEMNLLDPWTDGTDLGCAADGAGDPISITYGLKDCLSDITGVIHSSASLASFLADLGPTASSSVSSFRQAICESGLAIDEEQIARLLGTLAQSYKDATADPDLSAALTTSLLATSTSSDSNKNSSGSGGGDSGSPSGTTGGNGNSDDTADGEADGVYASGALSVGGWNIEVVKRVICDLFSSKLDWVEVARKFDYPGFYIPDVVGLNVLLTLYRFAAQRDLPVEVVYSKSWRNRAGHFSLLRAMLQAPPHLYSFSDSPNKVDLLEGLPGPDTSTMPGEAWLSQDLVATLMCLAKDSDLYSQVNRFA
jgi:hypothetical protein